MKRGHYSRSRSLADFNKRFRPLTLEQVIRKYISKDNKVRVLEIGCGEGRVLMELRRLFPTIELFGINKKAWPAMRGTMSLKQTGIFYKIFTKQEINQVNLPKIDFYDAAKLRVNSNSIDVVYSQVAIPYIMRKDRFLEEVWRVLKPGGMALLHIDAFHYNYPDLMQFQTPRFIVYDQKRRVVTLQSILKKKKKEGFDVQYKKVTGKSSRKELAYLGDFVGSYVIMRKNTKKPLELNLVFDETASFNLWNIPRSDSDIFWAYRSVFRTK